MGQSESSATRLENGSLCRVYISMPKHVWIFVGLQFGQKRSVADVIFPVKHEQQQRVGQPSKKRIQIGLCWPRNAERDFWWLELNTCNLWLSSRGTTCDCNSQHLTATTVVFFDDFQNAFTRAESGGWWWRRRFAGVPCHLTWGCNCKKGKELANCQIWASIFDSI